MIDFNITMRPVVIDDVFGYREIKTFIQSCKDSAFPKAILLTGMYGNGKTTFANIIADTILCKSNNNEFVFVNGTQAATESFVNVLKKFNQNPAPVKVMIIDEAQEMNITASKYLMTLLENDKQNTHFILTSIGNSDTSIRGETYKEIPKCIVSRCTTFYFRKFEIKEIVEYLQSILTEIEIQFPLNGLKIIAENSDGCLRQAIKTLEKCLNTKSFNDEDIKNNIGLVSSGHYLFLLQQILNGTIDEMMYTTLIEGNHLTNFNFMYKIISDVVCFNTFGKAAQDIGWVDTQVQQIVKHKNFEKVLNTFERLAGKGYLKKADFVVSMCNLIESCVR